jgi:regulator of protease activity HflC (stomatin/prohibitin superfamily)
MAGTIFTRGADAAGLGMGNLLHRLPWLGLIALILLIATSGYTIDTGNVGVTKTLGNVDADEVGPGFHLRLPFITEVREFSAKENSFDLTDLTPKAADNLSLRELDVTVFYKAA